METSNGTNWIQTESIILNHFRDFTVQFLWDQYTELSLAIFARCIALQCILLNFEWIYFEQIARNASTRKRETKIQEDTLKLILETNSFSDAKPSFGVADLLLVSDSTFAVHSQSKNRILETLFVELYQFTPIQIPTAVIFSKPAELETFVNPKRRLVMPIFSDKIILSVDLHRNLVNIGCFACGNTFIPRDYPTTGDTVYEIQFEPLWKYSVSSMGNLKQPWERLHSTIYFGSDNLELKCPSFSFYEIEPGKLTGELCKTFESILFEQDTGRLSRLSAAGNFLVTVFIFSTIVFRNFYTSTLYAFMAAEEVPTEYPKNIHELLNQSD
ncbi:unnamed protein product, partial [Orchesella dallaii]